MNNELKQNVADIIAKLMEDKANLENKISKKIEDENSKIYADYMAMAEEINRDYYPLFDMLDSECFCVYSYSSYSVYMRTIKNSERKGLCFVNYSNCYDYDILVLRHKNNASIPYEYMKNLLEHKKEIFDRLNACLSSRIKAREDKNNEMIKKLGE